jgi:protein CpxP
MYKKLLGIFVLVGAFVLTTPLLAHSGMCGEGMSKMLESLKLDDSQKQKIKPIMDSLKANMKQSADQMVDLSKQLNAQMVSETPDQSAVNDLVDKKAKLIGDMMKAKIDAKMQIYAVLNSQQKTVLQNKMKQIEEKMAEKFKGCHDQE